MSDDISDYPIGTPSPALFEQNVSNFDALILDKTKEKIPDRQGVLRYTYHGIEVRADRLLDGIKQASDIILSSVGYSVPVAYSSGIQLSSPNQTVSYEGQVYAPVADKLPFITSGIFEADKFRIIQGISSTDLLPASGAGLPGYSQTENYRDGSVGNQLQQSVRVNNQRGAIAIAGIIRRNPAVSESWETVQDAAHKPLNWVGPTGSGVDQRIEFTGGPVGAIVIGPDETFAKDGVTAGISGGNGGALISMGAPCTFEADVETLQITRRTARYYAQSRFSVSRNESTGLITVTHPGTTTHQRPLVQYRAKNSQGEVLIPSYVTSSGIGAGTTTFFLVGAADGGVTYTGSAWSMTGSAWASADVSFEWDATNGVLKVNHPRVLLSQGASPRVQVSLGGSSATPHFLIGFDVAETSFKVKFRTYDNQVPALNAGLGFYFSRGMTAIRKSPVGSVMIDIGRAQVNMSHVDAPSGNLWCLGINNVS